MNSTRGLPLTVVLDQALVIEAGSQIARITGTHDREPAIAEYLAQLAGVPVNENVSLFGEIVWSTTEPALLPADAVPALNTLAGLGAGITAVVDQDGQTCLFKSDTGSGTHVWSIYQDTDTPQTDEDALRALLRAWGSRQSLHDS